VLLACRFCISGSAAADTTELTSTIMIIAVESIARKRQSFASIKHHELPRGAIGYFATRASFVLFNFDREIHRHARSTAFYSFCVTACSRGSIKVTVRWPNREAARPWDQALENARPSVAFYGIAVLNVVSARARTNVARLNRTRVFDVTVERISLQRRWSR